MLAKKWLKEDELFPADMLNEDEAWEPLITDNDKLMSFLRQLYEMDMS